jgi:hypothetical protein
MVNRLQLTLYQLSNPRQIALVLTLILLVLSLTGCGDVIPACPAGGSGGSGCTGG